MVRGLGKTSHAVIVPTVVRGPIKRDGKPMWYISCPSCELVAAIDKDQYHGRVSIACPQCDYHATHDLAS